MLSWDHKQSINEHINRVARKMGGYSNYDDNTPEERTRLRKSAQEAVLPDYIMKCTSFETLREFLAAYVAGDFTEVYT